jgi:serine/threonine protein kinase
VIIEPNSSTSAVRFPLPVAQLTPYLFPVISGSLIRVKEMTPRSIEECIRSYSSVTEEDIGPAAVFIRRCLTLDPLERPSASELLEDEWLRDA